MSKDVPPPDDVAALQRQLLQSQQELLQSQQALEHAEQVLAETAEVCERQQRQITQLREELELFKRYIFGRRSERHAPDPRQHLLPLGADETSAEMSDEPPPPEEEITYRRRRKGRGWGKLPDHLPREEVYCDVPESERTCCDCGDPMRKIGEDRSERVDLKPAKIWVKVMVRPKYACSRGCGVKQAATPPAPVPGGRFDFGFVSHVVTSKLADHLPLYRQQDILARSGLQLGRSTLCAILAGAAELLSLLVDYIIQRLLAVDLLGADDTPVRLLDRTHPAGVRLARFWLFRGFDAAPYNVFYFHESRARDGPREFLQTFQGTVKVDAYGVDQGVYLNDDRMQASCCVAHARRKFEAALDSHPLQSAEALAYFQQLYDIEDRAREWSPDARRTLRECEAAPLLDRLRAWLDEQAPAALPKLKFGEAVGYARRQWSSLVNYIEDGRVPIDNNDVERGLRAMTIGRKNWLFVGSPDAGPRAAVLYTIVASAARHNLDIWAYLRDVLQRLAELRDALGGAQPTAEQLTPLLPDEWAKSHPDSIRDYRQREQEARANIKRRRRNQRRALARAKNPRPNG